MTNKESQQFANLLEKYWSNSLSEEEFQIFLNLLGQELVKQNELLDAQAAVDWQGSRAILKNIRIELDNRKNRSWWISVLGKSAAAIVLVCTVWFFLPGDNPPTPRPQALPRSSSSPPASPPPWPPLPPD